MQFRKILGFFAIVFAATLFASQAVAATGFVSSPLWITPSAPKEGDKVTLTALFRNAQEESISGTIVLYDGNTLLAEKSITLRPDEVGTVSTTFTISAGSHTFSASTKSIAEVSTTGSLDVITVPQASVKLPMQFVPKEIVPMKASAIEAQASNSSGDAQSNMVLEKVDQAQEAVLSTLPPDVRETVVHTTAAIDDWRSDRAETFSQKKTEAEKSIQAQKSAKPGAKKPSDAGPFTYLKYFIYSGLSFLFGSRIIFYLAAAIILYILFRVIFFRMRGKEKKPSARPSKASFHHDH